MNAPVTPPQTVGPFFADCLLRDDTRRLARPDLPGQHVRLEGTVLDADGAPVPDAVLELWQADGDGRYRHPSNPGHAEPAAATTDFVGWGRSGTDEDGRFWFTTVKPGPVAGGDGAPQAPHIVVQIFARGLLDCLTTRLYFTDELATDHDAVFATVQAERRATMLATPTGNDDDDGRPTYRFDVRLGGDHETVFFDIGSRRGGR